MMAVLSICGAGRLVDVQGISKDEVDFRSSNLGCACGEPLACRGAGGGTWWGTSRGAVGWLSGWILLVVAEAS